MSIEVLRQTVAAHNTVSPVGTVEVAAAQGQRRGEQVKQLNATSKVTDAAEEIGQAVSQKLDKRSLETRSIRQGQGVNIEAITRIAEYYEKLPDMPTQDKLKQLVNQLQDFMSFTGAGGGGSRDITPQDVLEYLQQFDGDVTHQYAALQIVIEHFENAGAPEGLMPMLLEAREYMETGKLGNDVRAGFAVAQLASERADDLGSDPATIREHYREILRNEPNFGVIFDGFREMLDRHRSLQHDVDGVAGSPVNSFDDVVDLFMDAAGHGLDIADTTDEPAHLTAVLTELGKLKSLRTVYEGVFAATQLTGRTSPAFKEQAQKVGLDELASRLFHYVGKSVVGPADAQLLVEPLAPAGVVPALNYTNNLMALHRDVPSNIIANDNIRVQQLDTLTTLNEQLTVLEEEQYQNEYQQQTGSVNAPERQFAPAPAPILGVAQG